MTTPPASLYVGCAIWAHKGWVGNFYPEKTKPADFLREGTSDDVLVNRSRERKPDVPVQPDLTADFAFVRLICNPVAELNEPYFAEWLPRLVNWLRGGTTVFLYTHCPDEVHSPVFARELHRRIAPQVEVAPYVPLRGCASELQQGALL